MLLRVCCILILILQLTGCVTKTANQNQLIVLDKSHIETPFWVKLDSFETKHFLYFIHQKQTELNTPQFAYRAVRKDIHNFFENESKKLFEHIKDTSSKNTVKKLVSELKLFLSKQLMAETREKKIIYWEKVKVHRDNEWKTEYIYSVMLQLSKKSLRLAERQYLFNKQRRLKQSEKSLLRKQLKSSHKILANLNEDDKINYPNLPDDIDINAKELTTLEGTIEK